MQITLDNPDTQIYIKAYETSQYIQLNQNQYHNSIIVSPESVLDEGSLPKNYSEITSQHIEKLLSFDADIYLLGTGAKHQTPTSILLKVAYQQKKPLDFMDTNAACRTFNLLASEYRKVVALLCLN